MSPSEIAFRTSGRSSYMSANPCSRVTVIVVDDMPGSPVMCGGMRGSARARSPGCSRPDGRDYSPSISRILSPRGSLKTPLPAAPAYRVIVAEFQQSETARA